MKSLKDPIFQKNKLYNLGSIVGGMKDPTTKHTASFTLEPGGDGHYKCDHSQD